MKNDQIYCKPEPQPNVFLALAHYPVLNRKGELVNTSVTNLDLHDLARLTRTYELGKYFIIQPNAVQQKIYQRIIEFWASEKGRMFNPHRTEAIQTVSIVNSLDEIKKKLGNKFKKVYVVATSARFTVNETTLFSELRSQMQQNRSEAYVLLFGTGGGLAESALQACDIFLEPVQGSGTYNHLSVRSAVSIIVSRLAAI